jgi:hypothetical protein
MIMSDKVVIALIGAIVVLIVLLAYRKVLRRFEIKGMGIESGFDTHEPAPAPVNDASSRAPRRRIEIIDNKLHGKEQSIEVEGGDAAVKKNELIGEKQIIKAGPDKTEGK